MLLFLQDPAKTDSPSGTSTTWRRDACPSILVDAKVQRKNNAHSDHIFEKKIFTVFYNLGGEISYGKEGPESQPLPYDPIQSKIILRSKIINMKNISHVQ